MTKWAAFHRPSITAREEEYVLTALRSGDLAGDRAFTKKCHAWLQAHLRCERALLTTSCSTALEMTSILLDLAPGDEAIMPSFNFTATANAVALRGATPVFVDIRPDTLNLDESKIEAAITAKTRAIFPVHYAGIACEMDTIYGLAAHHKLAVIEDAAQGLGSTYKGRALGTIGDAGTISFHATKNVIAGEGGALLVNRPEWQERAEIMREKGTNRAQYLRGQVDKYTWQGLGGSYLPSDLLAALLLAQLERSQEINSARLTIWHDYHTGLAPLEARGVLRRPQVPPECQHNGHIYYVVVESLEVRTRLLKFLNENGVEAGFHYIPLHTAPAGRRYGRCSGDLTVTEKVGDCNLRLPSWVGFTGANRVVELMHQFYTR